MRILLMEDDCLTAESIKVMVSREGFNLTLASFGAEGIKLAQNHDFDIIVLDLNLPDMHGLDLLDRLRRERINTPVLILSGTSSTETRVAGLRFGADDFLAKPFHCVELVARLHAVVRRSQQKPPSIMTVGQLEVDLDEKTASFDGSSLDITPKEFAVLELLMLRQGTTISKAALLRHLYQGMDVPETKIIDVFVCKLRRKIRSFCGEEYIHTNWGSGYVLHEPACLGLAA